jgi:16S rRNA (uracil1498-N3)-methyltransferase
LRLKVGDPIHITDGKGFHYKGRISVADPERCAFDIDSRVAEEPRPYFIHIAIAPTRQPDRLEWFLEKAVEIGVDMVTLLRCDHATSVRFRIDRLRKIAVSAMKQSIRYTLPEIRDLIDVKDFIAQADEREKLIAYVDANGGHHLKDAAHPHERCVVLIGPEGDFSDDELKWSGRYNFHQVSLGNHRLRTETAGVVACHILNLINKT